MTTATRWQGAWRLAGAAVFAWSATAPAMSLSQALDAAATHDPTAAVFQAQYEADREAGIIDRAAIRPSLDLDATGYFARTETESPLFGNTADDYPTWSATATARQPLFRLDWFAVSDRAKAHEDQAEIALRSSRLDLQRKVAERYFNVLIAQEQLAQAQAEAGAVRGSLDDTRRRYEVELVPGTDLKEAQARDDRAQAQLVTARRALDNARDELQETTGQGDAVLPSLPADVVFPALTPNRAEDWVAAAQDSSPRIAAATQAAIIARTNSTSTRAQAYPTLDLVGSASRSDTSEYDFGQRSDDGRVGVELKVPIYAGGATRAALRQAEAQLRVSEAEAARIKRETERETRQRFRTVETAYTEVGAYQKALLSAETAEAATRNGYDAGTRTITDVLDAQSRVVQARRDLNTTRYQLLLNLLQLKQTVGRLSLRDFAEIDALLRAPAAP